MKKIYVFMMALMVTAIVGCSNESVETKNDPGEELRVDYRLLDKNSNVTNEFHYGEEIVFDLIITNISDHELDFKNDLEIVATAFRVYTSDGQYVNSACRALTTIGRPPVKIKPGEQFHRQQIWGREPLPAGEYISSYYLIMGGEKGKTYEIKFKINENQQLK